MQTKLTSTNNIEIEASAASVWDTLTNPESIKQYLFGTEANSDWQVGSPLTFRGEWEGKKYEDKGTILEAEPNKLLKYSYWSSMSGKEDLPENYMNVTYQLVEKGGKTELSILQDGIQNEQELEHSSQNWQTVLNGIKKAAEEK